MSTGPKNVNEIEGSGGKDESKTTQDGSSCPNESQQPVSSCQLPTKNEAIPTRADSSNPLTIPTTSNFPIEANVVVQKSVKIPKVQMKSEDKTAKSLGTECEFSTVISPKLTLKCSSDSTPEVRQTSSKSSTGAIRKLFRRKSSSYKFEKNSTNMEATSFASMPRMRPVSENIEFRSPPLNQTESEDMNLIGSDEKSSGKVKSFRRNRNPFKFLRPYMPFIGSQKKTEDCAKCDDEVADKSKKKESSESKSACSSKEKREKPKKTRKFFGKNIDPLVASIFGKPIEKVCKIVENSDEDSFSSFPAQRTEDIEISSGTTGELISPFSKLSTDSCPSRKMFCFPAVDSQKIVEENTETKSSDSEE